MPGVPLESEVDCFNLGICFQSAIEVVGYCERRISISCTIADTPVLGDAVCLADVGQLNALSN